MNRGELVDAVSTKANITKKQTEAVLTAVLDTIIEAVSEGDKVSLIGFGSFEQRERQAREGRNPATGETIQIGASRKLGFAPAKPVRDRLNAGNKKAAAGAKKPAAGAKAGAAAQRK